MKTRILPRHRKNFSLTINSWVTLICAPFNNCIKIVKWYMHSMDVKPNADHVSFLITWDVHPVTFPSASHARQ
jgi:hypothetical protein